MRVCACAYMRISIHALREEGDLDDTYIVPPLFRFQSTPSARRATGRQKLVPAVKFYFNPRPPRGGRQGDPLAEFMLVLISIHALREEGDLSV